MRRIEKEIEAVKQPQENDILMGRGGKNNQHVGNEKFRRLARQECRNYLVASKKGKSSISRELVKQVRCMSPPGRFLKKNNKTGTWEDVGDEVAREKASQVLRDAISSLRDGCSEEKDNYRLSEESINIIPCPHSIPSVRPLKKRRYSEDFTYSELYQPNRVFPNHSNHYHYHLYDAPSRQFSSKMPRYDVISTWDECSSDMIQFHRSLPPLPHHTNPSETSKAYYQTPCNSPPASIDEYTGTDEFDIFNGKILNSDDDEEEEDDDSVNDVIMCLISTSQKYQKESEIPKENGEKIWAV